MTPDTPLEGPPELKVAEAEGEQAKKRRGRKKSKLEDMFPAYLQVRPHLRSSGPYLPIKLSWPDHSGPERHPADSAKNKAMVVFAEQEPLPGTVSGAHVPSLFV